MNENQNKHQLYNDTIMDRFLNPKNIGVINNPDAVAEVGAAACGDILKVTLKIDDTTKKITDAKAQIFGCASAISSADVAMDLIRGKTVDELENFSNEDVLTALGGVDEWKSKYPQKIHCSVLAHEALTAAIEDYKRRKNIQ